VLKPVDIETVEFKKVALGYSPEEVNNFLDKVIVDFEAVCKDNAKLKDKIQNLEDAIAYYKSLEETLKNSIILAEKTAADAKTNASQMSEQIIKEAQLKATEILQDANKKLYKVEYQALRLKNKYDSIKSKLKMLLNTEMEIINNCEKDDEEQEKEAEIEIEEE